MNMMMMMMMVVVVVMMIMKHTPNMQYLLFFPQ
jgi:hypothetical protein